jgi:hypothetical protein
VKVFNVHRGQDTGAWGHRLGLAFADDPDIEFSSMYAANAFLYLDYPTERPWDRKVGQQLWNQADVVHLHNGFRPARIFGKNDPKPLLVQYHGSNFRGNSGHFLQEQVRHGATAIVSTLDLWLIAPDLTEWVPSPYDLEWLDGLRR